MMEYDASFQLRSTYRIETLGVDSALRLRYRFRENSWTEHCATIVTGEGCGERGEANPIADAMAVTTG